MTRLRVQRVTKTFGHHPVFGELNLSLEPGDLHVISGGPSSGRTSALRCLSGTYRATTGQIVLGVGRDRVDLTTIGPRTQDWVRRRHLAVHDGPHVAPPSQPVVAVVARAAHLDRDHALQALTRLGVAGLALEPLGRLRSRQREAVGLAAALSQSAALVLLDAPEVLAGPLLLGEWLAEIRATGSAVVVTTGLDSLLIEQATSHTPLTKGSQR